MRKVYLNNLPTKNNRFDWKNCEGKIINFEFDGILGKFIITNYNTTTSKLTISYNGKFFEISPTHLKECKIKIILGLLTKEYKYNVGDIVENNKHGKILILEQIRSNGKNNKSYIYQCLICKNKSPIDESHLKANQGCSVCFGNKILIGFNDMWTTKPELAKLLYNRLDGYKYFKSTNKKLDWICPNCNNIVKNKSANQVLNNGLPCGKCSDGLSFAEKFIFNLLEQLNINFEREKIFSWSKGLNQLNSNTLTNKRYDLFILDYNTIIEIHGNHHYFRGFKGGKKRTLAEEQENDLFKHKIAIQNNISNYIIIDAKYSDLEYLKNSILKSDLAKLFDLQNIDWMKCCEYANKSLVKIACELWNNGIRKTKEISHQIGVDSHTVVRYLYIGNSLGLCNYSPKMSIISKPVIQICISTGNILDEFKGVCEASKITGISKSNISNNCKHKYKQAGGYKWVYSYEYYKNNNGGK